MISVTVLFIANPLNIVCSAAYNAAEQILTDFYNV